ncbi:MAG: hypothetical protein ACYTCU_03190 [Planctomycetota bacterium]|jgi:hypothetical protein
MKTTILLLVLVLLAGVLLTPTDPIAPDGSPLITRVTISDTPRSFEMDDGSKVTLDRRAIIVGSHFDTSVAGPSVRFIDQTGGRFDAVMVIPRDDNRIHAWPPLDTRGRMTLVVENPDGRKASATVEF